MSLITKSAHQRIVNRYQQIIKVSSAEPETTEDPEIEERLLTDLARLDELARLYLTAVAQLPELAREYRDQLRKLRIRVRKIQMKKKYGPEKP